MENKKYPGYAPDPQSRTNSDAFTDTETNVDSDSRLAEKGPVRNPNYHNIDDNTKKNNKQPAIKQGADAKTLEDFNKTDPKRDINRMP